MADKSLNELKQKRRMGFKVEEGSMDNFARSRIR